MRTLNANEVDAVNGGYINNLSNIITLGSALIKLVSNAMKKSGSKGTAANGASVECENGESAYANAEETWCD